MGHNTGHVPAFFVPLVLLLLPLPLLPLYEQAKAQIVLGDRPVEITLQRAWEALSTGERFELARSLAQLAFQRAGVGAGEGVDGDSDAEKVRHGRRPDGCVSYRSA